jgi:hypothetical protein
MFPRRFGGFLVFEFGFEMRDESMSSRGGKRPGAGRKPSTIRGIAKKLPRESAELVLAEINANSKWVALANSSDERIVLETLKYLTDRAYGRARQSLQLAEEDGPMVLVVRHIGTDGEQDQLLSDGPKTIEGDPASTTPIQTPGW